MPKTTSEHACQLLPGIWATEGQREALGRLERFLDSGDRTFTLIGRGGTGKTTVVRKVLDQAASRGLWVGGGAVSHAAKEVLGESLGESRVYTVAALLAIKLNEASGQFEPDEWARSRGMLPIRNFDVVVIDEASMISAQMLQEILEQAKPSAQIIFMGDNVQLPPIGDGEEESPAFTVSYSRNQSCLTERVRQGAESPIIPLSDLIARNIEGEGQLRALRPRDRQSVYDQGAGAGVLFLADEAQAVRMLVEDLRREPGNPRAAKAIVFNNERYTGASQSVLNLNLTIRDQLYGPDARNQFNRGEVVVAYSQWAPSAREAPLIHNAVSYIVESVSAPYEKSVRKRWQGLKLDETYATVDVSLRDHRGRRATVPVVAASDWARYQRDLADPSKARGALYFRLAEAFANLHYGYAITTHKAQGSTYRNVYVFEDNILGETNRSSPITRNKSLYVAVTRASHKLVMHSRLNPEEAPPPDPPAEFPEYPVPPLGRSQTPDQRAILERLRKLGAVKTGRELTSSRPPR